MNIAIIIVLGIVIIYLILDNALCHFKIGFYEKTLELNKHLFNEQYWKKIERIFKKKILI